jgi:CheY-like chemotaxis protein
LNHKNSILLVEDNDDDVYFVSRALRNSGLNLPLEVAHDGQEAVDVLTKAGSLSRDSESLRPCLVLLDLNLPLKSGLEVLKWIRQHSEFKTIIVVVLTSSTAEADMDHAYSLGANSYVIKPSDATKLAEFVHCLKAYWFGWNQLPPALPDGHAIGPSHMRGITSPAQGAAIP